MGIISRVSQGRPWLNVNVDYYKIANAQNDFVKFPTPAMKMMAVNESKFDDGYDSDRLVEILYLSVYSNEAN